MLKYTDTQITFREIPDEITLCINISGCPIKCQDCHSKELWNDIGNELTEDKLISLIKENPGITCVCFMGGDSNYKSLQELIESVKNLKQNLSIKIAFYSGRNDIQYIIDNCNDASWINNLDYIKVGSFIKELGGLDNPNTNQRLYAISPISSFSLGVKVENSNIVYRICGYDITYKFWNNDSNIA